MSIFRRRSRLHYYHYAASGVRNNGVCSLLNQFRRTLSPSFVAVVCLYKARTHCWAVQSSRSCYCQRPCDSGTAACSSHRTLVGDRDVLAVDEAELTRDVASA